jgi:hypothetical protein
MIRFSRIASLALVALLVFALVASLVLEGFA